MVLDPLLEWDLESRPVQDFRGALSPQRRWTAPAALSGAANGVTVTFV